MMGTYKFITVPLVTFHDTAPFIYFFQQYPDFYPGLKLLFDRLYATDAQAITSIITYIELTTHPARLGKKQLVRKYRDLLSNSENISIFALDMDIADHAVEVRAQYHFTTPDAIQLGTALACGADYILTNDKNWRRFKEIGVVNEAINLWTLTGRKISAVRVPEK